MLSSLSSRLTITLRLSFSGGYLYSLGLILSLPKATLSVSLRYDSSFIGGMLLKPTQIFPVLSSRGWLSLKVVNTTSSTYLLSIIKQVSLRLFIFSSFSSFVPSLLIITYLLLSQISYRQYCARILGSDIRPSLTISQQIKSSSSSRRYAAPRVNYANYRYFVINNPISIIY